MEKRIIAAFVIIVLLSGCGNKSGESSNSIDDSKNQFETLDINTYIYPEQFELTDNLKTALIELGIMYEEFDSSNIKEDHYFDLFISHYMKNTNCMYTFLKDAVMSNKGILSKEQVEYVQYSLTNTYIECDELSDMDVIDYNENTSGLLTGDILDYEVTELENERIKIEATYVKSSMNGDNENTFEMTSVLIKNPYSCFDGYSIESMKINNKTPAMNGNQKEYSFEASVIAEEEGVYTLGEINTEDSGLYDHFVKIDVSAHEDWKAVLNSGEDVHVTFIFDENMTAPISTLVPTMLESVK